MPALARAAPASHPHHDAVPEPRPPDGESLSDHPFRHGPPVEGSGTPYRRFRPRVERAKLPRSVPLTLTLRLLLRRETLTGLAMLLIGVLAVIAMEGSLLALAIPAVGLSALLRAIDRGLRDSRLLAIGRTTRARVVATRAGYGDDSDTRYVSVEFEVDGATIRTEHKLRSSLSLDGRPTTTVFYDPAHPLIHRIAHDLPGRPRLDSTGALQHERF